MSILRKLIPLAAALLVLSAPRLALAHGYIVRSIPEDRATLERAPARVQYWFSEDLEPEYSGITVRDAEGNTVARGGVDLNDQTLLTARLPTSLPDGAYISELRVAFASDGHVIVETRVFFVGEQVEGISGAAANDLPLALEVVWRVMVLASFVLLFGVFALYSLVLVPAWGNPAHRAGLLPPRVMNRLNGIVAVALVVACAGNALALLQQAMVFFNTDLSRVVGQNLWSIVRIGTRFGDVWNGRMLFLALVAVLFGASLYLRRSQPETVRAFWTANTWLMALVLGTLSASSHAAGSLLLPWLAMLADWLHVLAVGMWAGGVAALALVVPAALAPYAGDARRLALLAVLRRFSPLALAAALVVVTTGLYSASNWFYSPDDLLTTYGGALALKLLLVALLLLVGLAHYVALRPERYARWSGIAERWGGFVVTLRLEAVLVAAVLVAVGLLSATPLPRPDFAEQSTPPPSAAQTVGDLTLTATVTPGGPGVNSYDLLVTRGGEPVDGLDVRVRFADPALDWRSAWHAGEWAGDGLYIAAGDDIRRAGQWWMLVDAGETRYVFDWNISADAAVITSIPPGLLHVAALAGVLAALAYALRPLALRFYRRLDLSPTAVTVALGAVLATALLLVSGYFMLQASAAQYEATLNPPPQVINSVPPDAESLARGETLYNARCAAWETNKRERTELARSLARMRDEAAFAAVRDGWRTLPPCDANLTGSERWDIVNYLRTMESGA